MEATGRDDRLAEIVNNAEVFFSRDMRPRQAKLAPLAERIGPTVAEMTGCTPERDPRLVANWDTRSGYLKPRERFDRDGVDKLLRQDIANAASIG